MHGTTLEIDGAKQVFHLHGVDERGGLPRWVRHLQDQETGLRHT